MRVERRKRRRGGRVVRDRYYTGFHCFPGDSRETAYPLRVTDKQTADSVLRDRVAQEERRRAGIGIAPKLVEAASLPISDHVEDFVNDLRSLGRNRRYVREVRYRLRRLVTDCGWNYLRSVEADSFVAWRSRQRMAPKTVNEFLGVASQFCTWLIRQGRLERNPLAVVGRVDGRGKQTFDRRVLTSDEFQRLLDAAGRRRVVYLAAVYTALRRNALRLLQWGDVHLEAPRPYLAVRAATQKDRKDRIVWLHADLVAELVKIRPVNPKPIDRVFRRLLPQDGLGWFKADLAAAGIAFQNDRGERADFHALRHTACTWAGASGQVSDATLRAFTGHATQAQVARYTHTDRLPVLDVVEAMPRFALGEVSAERLTGTADGAGIGTVVGTEIGTVSLVANGPKPSGRVAKSTAAQPAKNTKNAAHSGQIAPDCRGVSQDTLECGRQGSNLHGG